MIDDIHFPHTVCKYRENVGYLANLNYDDGGPRQGILHNFIGYYSTLPMLL